MSVLQPLPVSLNKPFKYIIRFEWNKWMVDGEKIFSKSGNIRDLQFDTLCVFCFFLVTSWGIDCAKTVMKSSKNVAIQIQ